MSLPLSSISKLFDNMMMSSITPENKRRLTKCDLRIFTPSSCGDFRFDHDLLVTWQTYFVFVHNKLLIVKVEILLQKYVTSGDNI